MLIPDTLLKNKKILLGVTGSIAAYKSLELVRLFVKAGADVRVIMSESSKKFITPLSFETLTSNKILDDTNESWTDDHNHIKISQWADLFLIAPATANTIAKLSHAIADNILLQCALAYPGVKLLSPSANTNMIASPITQDNLQSLKKANYLVLDTQTKELACKTTGDGAMAEPIDIFWASARQLLHNDFWQNRNVVITGGGTIEKIDDVRYLSNFSSGKMASSLATAFYCMGANVKLIATKYENNIPKDINLVEVQSSSDILKELSNSTNVLSQEKTPYLFMAAAVSDYIPLTPKMGKLKKETLGENFTLSLTKNTDILSSLNKESFISIGFKAEMDEQEAKNNALNMLQRKDLNAVCLNVLKDSSSFGSDKNTIEFITHTGEKILSTTDKVSLSFEI